MTSDTALDGLFGDPSIIKQSGEYVMYYGAIKGDFSDPDTVRIFRATSPDGVVWTRNSVPVLTPGEAGRWDAVKVEVPDVLELPSGEYLMYYAGNDDTTEVGWQIGLATSADGVHWTKHPANPVLAPGHSGAFDELSALEPTVVYDSDQEKYYMWYTGITAHLQAEIGMAESQNGVVWKKLGRVLRLDIERLNPGDRGITEPDAVRHHGRFELFYATILPEGVGGAIWHAVSEDGRNWQKDIDPVLERGDSASWTGQGISAPSVLVDGGRYRMWYTGTHTDFATFFETGVGLAETSLTTQVAATHPDNPLAFELLPNYPNPFNPETTIRYQLPEAGRVTLTIYNLLGQKVRTLVNQNRSSGSYTVVWDGRNDAGKELSSGVYLYKLKVGKAFVATRKMLYLK
ncbi:MAG: T9SS C-terminal target domain-containing protein [Calditrichaeota bacterium]|nr:MAG: T9SS C-terminal target domain-containing protein [Calditrichota bacterium]